MCHENEELKHTRPGYILLLMLFLMITASGILAAIVYRSFVFQRLSKTTIDDTTAQLLAEGGLQLACDAVSLVLPSDKEVEAAPQTQGAQQPETPGSEKPGIEQVWLTQLLLVVNIWRTIQLTEEKDGVDAVLKLYITAEDGKIDLGHLLGVIKKEEEQKAKEAAETGAKPVAEKPTAGQSKPKPGTAEEKAAAPKGPLSVSESEKTKASLIDIITQKAQKTLKIPLKKVLTQVDENNIPFDDPSDLLRIDTVKKLDLTLFSSPRDPKEKKKTRDVELMDLFTVSSENGKLNPWLLSHSTAVLLGLAPAAPEQLTEVASKVKSRTNWAQDWDEIMSSVYGKKFESLDAAIRSHLSSQFDQRAFSVVVHVRVEKASRRLYALLERDYTPRQNLSPKSVLFRVSKIHWF